MQICKKSLKIDQYKGQIIETIANNEVSIISAPTGSGKTMAVPSWIADMYNGSTVAVTVPRVVMAKQAYKGSIALGISKKSEVKYTTGRGVSSANKPRIEYMTEGSCIMRKKWLDNNVPVIVIDEVHEQGQNTEALLTKVSDIIAAGKKVVLTSATMDIQRYVEHFKTLGVTVGHFEVPSDKRPFTLTHRFVDNPLKELDSLAKTGERILVGVAGKADIDKVAYSLSTYKGNDKSYKIFKFHGQMEEEEQNEVLNYDGSMIVVGTNVLQSGVTINDLSVGYFSGYGKRIETVNGISMLKKYELSKAELTQFWGRVGRTVEGEILHATGWTEEGLDEMPTAEILRLPLHEVILTFTSMGIDIQTANMLNKPKQKEIESSIKLLQTLGCLDESRELTAIGKYAHNSGYGLRGGILAYWMEQQGFTQTGQKMAAVMLHDSFRNLNPYHKSLSEFKEIVGYSDILFRVMASETVIQEFGYKVSELDAVLYKEKTDALGIFRKNFKRIRRSFQEIDKKYSDESPITQLKLAVQKASFEAFKDSVFTNRYNSYHDMYAKSDNKSIVYGDIVCGQIHGIHNFFIVQSQCDLSDYQPAKEYVKTL